MGKRAIGMVAILLTIVFIFAIVVAIFYIGSGGGGTSTTTSTPTSTASITMTTTSASSTTASSAPYISNVEIERYIYENEGLYMRLKISGKADLRDKVNINGVYGYWIGFVNVTLPDGSQGQLMNPKDHSEFFNTFNLLEKNMSADLYLPWEWYEKRTLEGAYNVTVWLQGPYENRTVLFKRVFNLRMSLISNISPTTWKSWDENVTLTLKNTGDLPLILEGVGMEVSGSVVGWLNPPSMEQRIVVIMPGESKSWVGIPTMAGDYKEQLSGKTVKVDFVLDIAGSARRFALTANISFP
ncbi:MAG: hypothetical protein ACP5RO_05880 [Fervidicoccaceae archaeon]